MNAMQIKELLAAVQDGRCGVDQAMERLRDWPAEEMGFACLDHHRALRTGFPEVVYGENKSAGQISAILEKQLARSTTVMATRVLAEKAAEVCAALPALVFHEAARMLTGREETIRPCAARGRVVVVSAGTSDMPVAEEAVVTARHLGHPVDTIYDVGVAGIHRLLAHRSLLVTATVLIVVAGMEGALPSVVGGLVDRPVIAVPTSVGYGTGFGGFAALLGMLNSCAPGVAVVNIDNGFGAGCLAAAINRL
ncbi:MAG: 1-(5-phosphoribosyl)-5-amino-4-imidazole-carboxylate carboxylase [Deltaproteobacteria bacterium RIFOXYD12_FULL_57_12]|nr:MAG: 1-(5-phosphoribosyl)-5-amino-4-imidazole-carboxylate carboxylase [Deltaproteobacteria bacterium RIFOXYD12_FULL_57_12]